jgi:hypothetical protein
LAAVETSFERQTAHLDATSCGGDPDGPWDCLVTRANASTFFGVRLSLQGNDCWTATVTGNHATVAKRGGSWRGCLDRGDYLASLLR